MNRDSINAIKLSEIVSMWGTNDERIGIELKNGNVYFTIEARMSGHFLSGNFNKK